MNETKTIKIAPSILAADAARLGAEAEKVEKGGAKWLHLFQSWLFRELGGK